MKIIFGLDGDLCAINVVSMRYVASARGPLSSGIVITCSPNNLTTTQHYWLRSDRGLFNMLLDLMHVEINGLDMCIPLPYMPVSQYTISIDARLKWLALVDNLTYQRLYNKAGTHKAPAL